MKSFLLLSLIFLISLCDKSNLKYANMEPHLSWNFVKKVGSTSPQSFYSLVPTQIQRKTFTVSVIQVELGTNYLHPPSGWSNSLSVTTVENLSRFDLFIPDIASQRQRWKSSSHKLSNKHFSLRHYFLTIGWINKVYLCQSCILHSVTSHLTRSG